MGKLDGKVAAITGGTRSIGRAIADAFVREGASVVINGRDEAKGQTAVDEIGAPDRTAFYGGDAAKQATCEGIVDFAIERFGKLDIMVLNSGGVLNTAPVFMMTDEEWNLEIDWNLNHVFWGMRKSLQHMIERNEGGRILVTSSVEGKLGKPGIPGYAATKHAVNGLVKAAAHEVGTMGITVNAILPGIIETDIVRTTGPDSAVAMGVGSYDKLIEMFTSESAIKKPNTVEQVAAVAVMLASDAARNMTGCMFPVDGGTMPY
jgi:3-hydroxybutyrate dehydrogenase